MTQPHDHDPHDRFLRAPGPLVFGVDEDEDGSPA
jgi:hypothetical protein